jgi:hypothetical protein
MRKRRAAPDLAGGDLAGEDVLVDGALDVDLDEALEELLAAAPAPIDVDVDVDVDVPAGAPADASRRRVLRTTLLGLLGLAGTGLAARAAADAPPVPDEGSAVAASGSEALVLRGVDWRLHRPTAEPGALPTATDVPSTHGRLVDADGAEVGRFSSAAVPGAGGSFALHSFDLVDGTLLGMGSGPLAEAAFAIVGGTGRYAGATGSYTARQRPRGAGGDGTAEFSLQIRTGE